MGYTEVALNRTFYTIDILGKSVLYILPVSNPDAGDFTAFRFDPALELSPHLSALFSDVKNIGHKRAGSASLFIRGSRSRSQLKSLPVSRVIADEADEMPEWSIPLAVERMSGQAEKSLYLISTPSIPEYGIDSYFIKSNQSHFFFPCPHCSRSIELIFPDSLVITDPISESHLICNECKHKLEHAKKYEYLASGLWVPQNKAGTGTGFYINQLYSSTMSPPEIAQLAVLAESDPVKEQELYNSKAGLPHATKGASVTREMVSECVGWTTFPTSFPMVTMGIDVGVWLHYEITGWSESEDPNPADINYAAIPFVIAAGKCKEFSEILTLIKQYDVQYVVCDALPERRMALQFAQTYPNSVRLCFYVPGISGKVINHSQDAELTISVDRTSWLDLSLLRFARKAIVLPSNISEEYKKHITVPVKVYAKNKDGITTARYVSATDDHFAHARNYSEIALKLGGELRAATPIY